MSGVLSLRRGSSAERRQDGFELVEKSGKTGRTASLAERRKRRLRPAPCFTTQIFAGEYAEHTLDVARRAVTLVA